MDIKQQIKIWLESPSDLSEGMRLFKLAGGKDESGIYDAMAAIGKAFDSLNAKSSDMIVQHLESYLSATVKEKSIIAWEEKNNQLPDSIVKLRHQQLNAYNRYRELKKELWELRLQGEPLLELRRHKIAMELMSEVVPETKRTSQLINNYEDNGILPPLVESMEGAKEAVALYRRKETTRVNISRLKRDLKKELPSKDKLRIEKAIEGKENILREINYQLGIK